jgi:hypothetical protein
VTSRACVAIALVGALAFTGCAHEAKTLRAPSYDGKPPETHARYGIACVPGVPTGNKPDPEPPPPSYAVGGIGKPGFPALASPEATMVQRIRRYVHSQTLRIAWLPPHGYRRKTEFIVFDASGGPCNPTLVYGVLNGYCNEMYRPSDDPYATWAAPDCSYATPRPWMTAVRSNPRR